MEREEVKNETQRKGQWQKSKGQRTKKNKKHQGQIIPSLSLSSVARDIRAASLMTRGHEPRGCCCLTTSLTVYCWQKVCRLTSNLQVPATRVWQTRQRVRATSSPHDSTVLARGCGLVFPWGRRTVCFCIALSMHELNLQVPMKHLQQYPVGGTGNIFSPCGPFVLCSFF